MNQERKVTAAEVEKFLNEQDSPGAHFGIKIERVDEKGAVATLPFDDRHTNAMKTAHGAVIFLVADLAFAAACAGQGVYCVTVQTSLSYLDPGKSAPIKAEATLIRSGAKLMIFNIAIHDGEGTLIAQGIISGYKKGSIFNFI